MDLVHIIAWSEHEGDASCLQDIGALAPNSFSDKVTVTNLGHAIKVEGVSSSRPPLLEGWLLASLVACLPPSVRPSVPSSLPPSLPPSLPN